MFNKKIEYHTLNPVDLQLLKVKCKSNRNFTSKKLQ